MYKYGITNKNTNERNIIFGYNYADACRRCKVNPDLWEVEYQEYVD